MAQEIDPPTDVCSVRTLGDGMGWGWGWGGGGGAAAEMLVNDT